ncbi:MAG: 5-(carboxyamino)imidazole ribonucleotide mutase [Tepidiformaceae bacterium]|nr:5-(carboxyamino)imidazole ribonucleotide mutase [Dehalococcoidia bacterium]
MSTPLVAILMGSKNDMSQMEPTEKVLTSLDIPFETKVMSAHRNPDKVRDFAKTAIDSGFEIVICAAGGAAHLPGAVAANTTLPVIGVPLPTSDVAGGQDAVFGVLQMPPGVPVAGVAVGGWGARNAAYLAAAILSLKHDDIKKNYTEFRTKQAEG